MPTELNDGNFDQEIKKGKAIVDFWAEWCGPCKILGPRFEELSKEMTGINFFKLNVDMNEETAAKYGIRSIPTMIMFKDGQKVGQIIGAMSKDALKDKFEQAFA